MAQIGHPKNQHYVPLFLLKNFHSDKSDSIFCYDKQDLRPFETNPKNVACEKWFYDLHPGHIEGSLEHKLSSLESACSLIINGKILTAGTLRNVSTEDRAALSLFIAVQMVRTRQFRESVWYADQELAKLLRESGIDPIKVRNYRPFESEDDVKDFSLFFARQATTFVPNLLEKTWLLYESENSFVIGDNPVALHNTINESKLRSTRGIAVKGIEIYLPISPRFTLCLLCRDTFRLFETQLHLKRAELERNGSYNLHNFVVRVKRRIPVPCEAENVEHLNSLQVTHAERYLFSHNEDFSLVESMIHDDPNLRHGPRMTIG